MKLAFMLLNRRQLPNSWSPVIAAQSATLYSSVAPLEKNLEANEYPLLQFIRNFSVFVALLIAFDVEFAIFGSSSNVLGSVQLLNNASPESIKDQRR